MGGDLHLDHVVERARDVLVARVAFDVDRVVVGVFTGFEPHRGEAELVGRDHHPRRAHPLLVVDQRAVAGEHREGHRRPLDRPADGVAHRDRQVVAEALAGLPLLAVGLGELRHLRAGQWIEVRPRLEGGGQGVADEIEQPVVGGLCRGAAREAAGEEVAGGAGRRVVDPPDRAAPGVAQQRLHRDLDHHPLPRPGLDVGLDLGRMAEGGEDRREVGAGDGDDRAAAVADEAEPLVGRQGVDLELLLEEGVLEGRAVEAREAHPVAARGGIRRRVGAAPDRLGDAQRGVERHPLPEQALAQAERGLDRDGVGRHHHRRQRPGHGDVEEAAELTFGRVPARAVGVGDAGEEARRLVFGVAGIVGRRHARHEMLGAEGDGVVAAGEEGLDDGLGVRDVRGIGRAEEADLQPVRHAHLERLLRHRDLPAAELELGPQVHQVGRHVLEAAVEVDQRVVVDRRRDVGEGHPLAGDRGERQGEVEERRRGRGVAAAHHEMHLAAVGVGEGRRLAGHRHDGHRQGVGEEPQGAAVDRPRAELAGVGLGRRVLAQPGLDLGAQGVERQRHLQV